jgi:hypothetical protein
LNNTGDLRVISLREEKGKLYINGMARKTLPNTRTLGTPHWTTQSFFPAVSLLDSSKMTWVTGYLAFKTQIISELETHLVQ